MSNRTRTLGALALTATGAAMWASGASAQPPDTSSAYHTVSLACVNQRVVVTGSLFPATPAVTSGRLTIDGVPQPVYTISPGVPGPSPVVTFPTPLYGDHVVVAELVNGGTWTSPATPVRCGPPPVPETPPAEVPQDTTIVTPLTPLTCAEWRAINPKRGPNFWRALGCPVPKVKKPPLVERPPKLTCIDLKRRKAGMSWYVKLGIPYYACNVPKAPKRPYLPPVAG